MFQVALFGTMTLSNALLCFIELNLFAFDKFAISYLAVHLHAFR
jgi:hypothetical protein